jgi:hypothetical protein
LKKNTEERAKLKEKKKSSVVHDYKPEEYGLTAEMIREEFKDYIARFDLLEKKAK